MFKKWVPIWTIPLLVVFSLGTIWIRLQTVRTSYTIHQLQSEIKRLKKQEEELSLRISALKSPSRLESLARHQFRLARPPRNHIISSSQL